MTRFYIGTAISVALIFDLFMFTTGNFSLIFSILGGWFQLHIAAILLIAVWLSTKYGGHPKKYLLLIIYGLAITITISASVGFSNIAREYAANKMQDEINMLLKMSPRSNLVVDDRTRQLISEISPSVQSVDFETFIPTFRRADFNVTTKEGGHYYLVIVRTWNGRIKVYIRS